MNELDRIFADRQKRVDVIWEKFEAKVKADIHSELNKAQNTIIRFSLGVAFLCTAIYFSVWLLK